MSHEEEDACKRHQDVSRSMRHNATHCNSYTRQSKHDARQVASSSLQISLSFSLSLSLSVCLAATTRRLVKHLTHIAAGAPKPGRELSDWLARTCRHARTQQEEKGSQARLRLRGSARHGESERERERERARASKRDSQT